MKRFLALSAAFAASFGAFAAEVDLAGQNMELTELSSGDTYVNSGDPADLIVTVAGGTTNVYNGSISGPIRLVKKGTGVLRLTSANDYTRGSYVDVGVLEGRNTGAFGSGTITVKGLRSTTAEQSAVRFCAAGTFANDIVVENGIDYAEGNAGWQKPQIEFSASGTSLTTTLSGSITGPSGDQKLWITDQDARTACGTDAKLTVRLTGGVTTKYLFGTPIYPLYFDGPVKVTRMWLNRSNNTTGWKNAGAVHFKSSENEIGRIGYGYNYIVCDAAHVLDGTILSADYQPAEASWTYFAMSGYPQNVAGFATTQSKTAFQNQVLGAVVNSGASYNKTDKRATLTIAPQDSTVTWSPTRFYGPVDVVFAAKDATIVHDFYNRSHDQFTGTITVDKGVFRLTGEANMPKLTSVTVKDGGQFDVQTSTNITYFSAVTNISVASGGKFLLPFGNVTQPFAFGIRLTLATGAEFSVPEGLTIAVNELWVDGHRKIGGRYGAADLPDGLLTGGGLLDVANYVVPEEDLVPHIWTGAGADTSVSNADNWAGETVPDLVLGGTLVKVTGGTGMTLPGEVAVGGILFDCAENANFEINGTGSLTIGTAAIRTAHADADTAVRTYSVSVPVSFVAPQLWRLGGSNTVVNFNGVISSSALESVDRMGSATLHLRAANTFSGPCVFTNGVTHVWGGGLGLGTDKSAKNLDVGRMPGTNTRLVFHGGTFPRQFSFCSTVATTASDPLFEFAEGETVLSGQNSRSIIEANVAGTQYILMREGATAVVEGAWNTAPYVNFSGPGTLAFTNDSNVAASHQYFSHHVVIEFRRAAARTGSFGYSLIQQEGSTFDTYADWALNANQKMAGEVQIGGLLRLHGYSQRLTSLSGGGKITTDRPADLYLDFSRTDDRPQYMHVTSFAGTMEGPVSVFSVGTNQNITTVGELGSTGALAVLTNELNFAASTTWTNCTGVTVTDRGRLVVSRSGQFARDIGWTIGGQGVVSIGQGCVQRAGTLTLDGVRLPDGTYSATSVPADVADPESVKAHFAGAGVLKVGTMGMAIIFR